MFSPRDYDGDTPEADRREEDARAELVAQEEEEQDARIEAFARTETPWCEAECFDKLAHTVACQAINEPVLAALESWRRAVAPRYARIMPGIAVRVGTRRKRRAA